MESLIGSLLLVLLIAFVIFLILRELMCWYWKINLIVSVLESIDSKISQLSVSLKTATNQLSTNISESSSVVSESNEQNKEIIDYSDSYLVKCPNCENKEIVKRIEFKNPAVYKNFVAEVGGVMFNMKFQCKKCGKSFKL